MIKKFVDLFMARKGELEKAFRDNHPKDYKEIVSRVITVLSNNESGDLDKNRIHEIDDGDYQGTLLYVITVRGYQPSDYWYVKIRYGSCSGCDTLESIRRYCSKPPTNQQVEDYMALALRIVQGLHKMENEAI